MQRKNGEVHVTQEEASGGSKEGVVRWVLVLGTLLAIVLLSAIWIFGAASQGDVESEITATGRIDAQENDGADTDSIILETDQNDTLGAEPVADTGVPQETIEN